MYVLPPVFIRVDVLKREDSIKNGCSQYVNSVDIFQKQIYLSIYTEKDENQYIKVYLFLGG